MAWCEEAWEAALEYERFNHKYCIVGSLDKLCEKLEAENKEYKEAARSEAEEVNRLQAQNKKLREALEFYAEPDNYSLSTHIRPRVRSTQRILTIKDLSEVEGYVLPVGGLRAREALKELEDK
jgi:hypothetical protein